MLSDVPMTLPDGLLSLEKLREGECQSVAQSDACQQLLSRLYQAVPLVYARVRGSPTGASSLPGHDGQSTARQLAAYSGTAKPCTQSRGPEMAVLQPAKQMALQSLLPSGRITLPTRWHHATLLLLHGP